MSSTARPGDLIAEFLSHLVEQEIISNAQLQMAKEALGLWRPLIQEGAAEQQQALGRRAGPLGHFSHVGDEDQQQQDQRAPEVPVPTKRCISQSTRGGECAVPAAVPRDDEAEAPLALLPDHLLDHLMSLLSAEPGGSCIRPSCRWLRSAFDRRNTRLVLKQPTQLHPPPRPPLKLLLCNPSIKSLTVEEGAAHWSWAPLADAGHMLHHLERLSLRHYDEGGDPFISHCSKLQHLDLQHCRNVDSLDHLAPCVELQHLDLRGCSQLDDLSRLASSVRLQHLDLRGCVEVKDLGPLASCVRLQHLDLCWCNQVEDLAPLASCVELQYLDLTGLSVRDLGPLSTCSALQHLDVRHCGDITDIGMLTSCTQLRRLCFNSWAVKDLRPLAACGQLKQLTILRLPDFIPLPAYAGLQYLEIGPRSTVQDLGLLAACVQLRQLTLHRCNGVQDLAPLAACVQLRALDLSYCHEVEDLMPLASCVELRTLDLQECSKLEDLTPLSGCVKLQYLDLRGCEVADLTPLAACGDLQLLQLSACTGENLRPLATLSCRIVFKE